MSNHDETDCNHPDASASRPYRVRLPGFLADEDVGLGEVIKRATATVGVPPCGGCARRAAALDRWLRFSGRRQGD
jgi:hypothetical protein